MADIQLIKVSQLPFAETLEGLSIFGIDTTNNRSVQALMSLLKGLDGKPAEIQKSATHLQWRVQGESTWINLVTLDELKVKGDTGANIELQVTATHVQWRVVGGTWANLVALSELKGAKGDPGANIELQKTATYIQWRVVGGTWANLIALSELKGDTGKTPAIGSITAQSVASGQNPTFTLTNSGNVDAQGNPIYTGEIKIPAGAEGKNLELQKTSTHLQWRVEGGSWANLIPLSDLKGDTGNNIELQKTATHIQWQVTGGTWANLVTLEELKGAKGDDAKEPVFVSGTTTTLDPDEEATAEVVADGFTPDGNPKFKINLSIPRGQKGTAGDGSGNVTVLNYATGTTAKIYVLKPSANGSLSYNIQEIDLSSFLTEETDPTVPGWAKQVSKPSYDKSEVGLGNVDNTSDTDKPVSTAQATAINSGVAEAKSYTDTKVTGYIPITQKGSNNGVAELDSTGKVLSSQLPSYVDDVLEYATLANFPTTGETGKIYIAINTNLTYRWTGTAYTEISPSIALGETSATAYRGDRGKIAYDHSQASHAPANAQKNSDITKAEIEEKLTGAITTHTHDYVPTNSFKGSTFTANVIPLDNPLGAFRVATASNAATYTLSATKVAGAWAKILVNRATEPAVTGGTLITGSDFKASTNMYLYVSYDGTKSEYYFAEI